MFGRRRLKETTTAKKDNSEEKYDWTDPEDLIPSSWFTMSLKEKIEHYGNMNPKERVRFEEQAINLSGPTRHLSRSMPGAPRMPGMPGVPTPPGMPSPPVQVGGNRVSHMVSSSTSIPTPPGMPSHVVK